MTGNGHRLTGIGAAFFAAAITRHLGAPEAVAALFAAITTTMPDWVEIPFMRNGVRIGSLIPHRTITHWPALWISLFVWGAFTSGLIGAIAIGVAIGNMTHILGDAPNPMGIPWLLPHKRLRIRGRGLWRSGQHEFLIVVGYSGAGYLAWKLAGGELAGYI